MTGANDNFAAVARLRAAYTCTGTLIDPAGRGSPDAKAWLLTAGHCISLDPYGVIRNLPLTAQVQFNYFIDTPDRLVTVRSRAVGWSTMKGVDIALIELEPNLGDLQALGIRPLRLAATVPDAGSAVFWTGIPQSPIPPELQFLRLGRCTLGARVRLLEGSWIWNNELSNDCPDLYAGASGSPLFDRASGDVIGAIGTGTLLNLERGPDYDCQTDRPCVQRTGGPVMQKNTSYASSVQAMDRCFDQANVLDVELPGCPLDSGVQLTIQSTPYEVQPLVEGKPASWGATLTGTQRYYAYKHFPAGEGDCADLGGYSAPILRDAVPVITDPVGIADGYYYLCVIAGDTASFDSSWQQPSHASIRFKRLDSLPPLVGVDYQIQPLLNAYELDNLTGGEGTSDLIGLLKRGPLASTDCFDPLDYRIQVSIPQIVRTSEFPTRICWKLMDRAGNIADPVAFDFGPPVILPNGIRNAASFNRGTVAPGSVFGVETFELTDASASSSTPVPALAGVRMSVVDSSGRTLPVPMTMAGPQYQEAVMPDEVKPGVATVIVQPPLGPAVSQSVNVQRSAPGLYFNVATGIISGYASDRKGNLYPFATCSNQTQCFVTQLPLSTTPGGLDFTFYGTGLRGAAGSIRIRIGTHPIDSVDVCPHRGMAGVDDLRFHLAQEFPLRLFQVLSAETPDGTSNFLWIYLE